MPKIINAYTDDDGLAKALTGLAGNIFGGNQAQQEVYRQTALSKRRENENIPLLADAVTSGDFTAANRHGILSDKDPKFTAGYNQSQQVQQYGIDSPQGVRATMSVPGANFGNTVQGTREEMRNRRTIADMTTSRQVAADQRRFDNTFRDMVNPQGQIVPVSQSQVPTRVQEGYRSSVPLTQQQGAFAGRAVERDGGIAALPPAEQNYIGAQPTNENAYTATLADGSTVPAIQRADGFYHAQTGQKLPNDIRSIQKFAPTTADAMSDSAGARVKLWENRAATDSFVAAVDNIDKLLSNPNADQAMGWLGQGATFINNTRAQYEAAVKGVGGKSFADEIQGNQGLRGVVDNFMRDPSMVDVARRLSIDHSVLRSSIVSLAYLHAKATSPGIVTGPDFENSLRVIGGNLMDPVAMRQVLRQLKTGVVQGQQFRESAYKRTFEPGSNRGLSGGGAPGFGTPAATESVAPVDWQTYFGTP